MNYWICYVLDFHNILFTILHTNLASPRCLILFTRELHHHIWNADEKTTPAWRLWFKAQWNMFIFSRSWFRLSLFLCGGLDPRGRRFNFLEMRSPIRRRVRLLMLAFLVKTLSSDATTHIANYEHRCWCCWWGGGVAVLAFSRQRLPKVIWIRFCRRRNQTETVRTRTVFAWNRWKEMSNLSNLQLWAGNVDRSFLLADGMAIIVALTGWEAAWKTCCWWCSSGCEIVNGHNNDEMSADFLMREAF